MQKYANKKEFQNILMQKEFKKNQRKNIQKKTQDTLNFFKNFRDTFYFLIR